MYAESAGMAECAGVLEGCATRQVRSSGTVFHPHRADFAKVLVSPDRLIRNVAGFRTPPPQLRSWCLAVALAGASSK